MDLGLEVKGEWEMEGDLMGYAIGLKDVKVCMCRTGNARQCDQCI